MYLEITMEQNISLHSRHLGHHLREGLEETLTRILTASYSFIQGHITTVTEIESVGEGTMCSDGTGCVSFPVRFQCMMFKPFQGEILEVVVTRVHRLGIFAAAGLVQIFISYYLIPDYVEFKVEEDMPVYRNADGTMRIERDSELKVKIVGIRLELSGIFCVGTIKGDFLGLIDHDGLEG